MQLAGKHQGERCGVTPTAWARWRRQPGLCRQRISTCLHPSLPACLPACPGAGVGHGGERYLQFGVGSVDQPVAEDGVPVLNVRATGKSQPHVSPTAACPTAPAWGAPAAPPGNSLESEGAAVEFLGSAEPGFLGRGAAEQEELVGGVHELQLLPGEREEQRRRRRGERTDRQTDRDHARQPGPVPVPARLWLSRACQEGPRHSPTLVPHPTAHVRYPPSYIPYPASHVSQAADPIPKAASYIPDPDITHPISLDP